VVSYRCNGLNVSRSLEAMHCGVLCWHGDLGGSWQRRGHGFFPSDGSNASKGMEVLGRTKSGKSWYLHRSFTSQTKFEELSLLVLCVKCLWGLVYVIFYVRKVGCSKNCEWVSDKVYVKNDE